MRRAPMVGLAAAVALLAAAPAGGEDHDHGGGATGVHVSAQYESFTPVQIDVLAGDAVHWTNDSARAHDIVGRDGSFDSGRVLAGGMYDRRFDEEGSFAYYCSIHPAMAGEVSVHRLLLDTPKERGAPNRPYVLAGRSAVADTSTVTVEGDDGSGFRPVATAAVGDDGGFRATVVPRTTTTYRAVAQDSASPPVPLLVVDRTVVLATRRQGGATAVAVRVTPAAPHQLVSLQLRLKERFGWWTVRRVRLDHMSAARFVVRPPRGVRARVVLTLPDGWTELAASRSFRVRGH